MSTVLLVVVGSGIGGMARYGLTQLAVNRLGRTFPWGTLAVNVLGSFAIGLFLGYTGGAWLPLAAPDWHHLVTYGFLGGFTTFSTLSLEAIALLQAGDRRRAAAYIGGSLVLGLGAVVTGFTIGQT